MSCIVFSEQAAIVTHCTHSVYHEDFEIGHMELDLAVPCREWGAG